MNIKRKILRAVVFLLTMFSATTVCSALDFTSDTFSDVNLNNWYYSGVEAACQCGAMQGVGNGKFSPNSKYTLAQATTTAARLHASSNGETIKSSDEGKWYDTYVEYADKNGLLSESMKKETDLDKQNATRSEAAFLFYKVLSVTDKDAKIINSSKISDIDQTPSEYQEAVKAMFERGIFTGVDEGIFSGNSDVTRAQIAVIIQRIIDTSERISYDQLYNYEVAMQPGNIYSDESDIIYDDNYTFYAIKPDRSQEEYSIAKQDNATGASKIIYNAEGEISNLRLKDGKLYFIEKISEIRDDFNGNSMYASAGDGIVCYDIYKDAASVQYRSDKFLDLYSFELYGDAIYVNEEAPYSELCTNMVSVIQNKEKSSLFGYNHHGVTDVDLLIYDNKIFCMGQLAIPSLCDIYDDNIIIYDMVKKNKTEVCKYSEEPYCSIYDIMLSNGFLYAYVSADYEELIYRYNIMTGNDFDDEKEVIYRSGLCGRLEMCIDKGTVYLGFDELNCVYKVLPDLAIEPYKNTNASPLTIHFNGRGEVVYSRYWSPMPGAAYNTENNDIYNGIIEGLNISNISGQGAANSVLEAQEAALAKAPDTFKDISVMYYDARGKKSEYRVSINEDMYLWHKNEDRTDWTFIDYYDDELIFSYDYALFAFCGRDIDLVEKIADDFKKEGIKQGYSDLEIAQTMANFVQSIKYVTDDVGTGYEEYPKFPVETLYELSGDCEDTSALLVALYSAAGYDCALLCFEDHMAVGLKCEDIDDGCYIVDDDNSKYYYIETTHTGWKIGEVPQEIEKNPECAILSIETVYQETE